MKKIMSLFLSVALLASMLSCVTSVFAFEGYKAETSLLDGIPAQNQSSFSQNGYSAQIYAQANASSASWSDGMIKVTSSVANGYAIADIKSNYNADAINSATDDFLEFSFEVSYNGSLGTGQYNFEFYDNNDTRIAQYLLNWSSPSQNYYRGGTGTMDTTGATTDVITARVDLSDGTVNGFVDGKILTNMNSVKLPLTNGIGKARLWWYGEKDSSINFHNFSLNTSNHIFYDHEVLMSGIENFDGAAVNGVSYADTNAGTVTKADDGKVTISGLQTAYTRLTFDNSTPIVNGTTFPDGGKIYYEQTVSFSAIPTLFSLAFKDSDDRYESARPSLFASTDYGNGTVQCWNVGEGDRFQFIQIMPNTPYKIGVLYDLETGEYQAYVNGKGANACKGTWSPNGDLYSNLDKVWLEVKLPTDADTITISDLFVMRTEPSNFNLETGEYETNTDVLFSGISHVPGCYKWSDNGFLYQTIGNATLSKDDLCTIKATADAKGEYVRMKLDAAVNETTYPSGITVWEWDFEIESQNAEEPHYLEFNNGGKGIAVFEKNVLPGKHTAEFVYNPKTGEYRYYIDGVASDVYSISKDTGIDTLYLEWQGNAAGDACVLENVKFSNLKEWDGDSIGSITITDNTATVNVHASADYSLIPDSLDFIVAAYDDNNQMVALHYETKTLEAGDNTLSVNLTNTNGGTKIKAFLWNSITNGIKPVTVSAEN